MLDHLSSKIRRRLGPRRFRAYGVGPGKAGTRSLANVFRRHYRAEHEPEAQRTLDLLLRFKDGAIGDDAVVQFLRDRDRRLRLEMDCAGYNALLARYLAEEFADAKFVLTVRDCFTWANSAMNQLINNPTPGQRWRAWRTANFGRIEDCRYEPEEAVLAERGMWSLARILGVWAEHYRAVLDTVPEDRIFVMLIQHIGRRQHEIAAFLGIAPERLAPADVRSSRTPHDHGLLAQLPEEFVDRCADAICGDLMARFYPDAECRRRAFMPGGEQPGR